MKRKLFGGLVLIGMLGLMSNPFTNDEYTKLRKDIVQTPIVQKSNISNRKINPNEFKISPVQEYNSIEKFVFAKNYENIVRGTVLEGSSDEIWREGIKEQIDPYFIGGVMLYETGKGKSSLVKRSNNVGGLGGAGNYMNFEDVGESVHFLANLIQEKYFQHGKDTITKVGSKYCPGCSEWPHAVADYMEELSR